MRRNTKSLRRHRKDTSALAEFSNGAEFDMLSDQQKEAVWESYNRVIPLSETRPPTAQERAIVRNQRRRIGRPKVGKGVKVISLSVERGLLKQADAYAKSHGMKRAELVSLGLRLALAASERSRQLRAG